MLAQLVKNFPNEVLLVYRYLPLVTIHDKAALSVQAAEAAGKQGKFWVMHDLLFEKQAEWIQLTVADYTTWLVEQATGLDLNADKFKTDLNSQELKDFAQNAWDSNQKVGITSTPFLVVNGNVWPSNIAPDYANLSAVIKLTELEERQFTQCPPMTIDQSKHYTATLHTDKGDVVIELYADKAPLAVNSFIFLAQNGWYDGVTFHRVLSDFVAQAGDPTGTGYGGPGYFFKNEISPDLKYDKAGVVGMANAGADSNGSQFFIIFAAQPQLDGNYTIFGQVISGMDVLQNLTPRDPSKNADLPPGDKINSVTIEVK